jgi:thiol-disulfide isomerase/thioredoxin
VNRLNPNRQFKLAILLIVLYSGLATTACAPQETSYPTLEGKHVTLSGWQGKVVFINYWAEWCRPCRVEIPELNQFAKQHSENAKVFSVNFDGVNGADLIEQVAALGIEFDTLLVDPRGVLGAPPSAALPETLVIGRQGKLYKVLLGPQTLESLNEVMSGAP